MDKSCSFVTTCKHNKDGECAKEGELCWLLNAGYAGYFTDDINNGERVHST